VSLSRATGRGHPRRTARFGEGQPPSTQRWLTYRGWARALPWLCLLLGPLLLGGQGSYLYGAGQSALGAHPQRANPDRWPSRWPGEHGPTFTLSELGASFFRKAPKASVVPATSVAGERLAKSLLAAGPRLSKYRLLRSPRLPRVVFGKLFGGRGAK
jgi:hypothetical protein